LGLRLEKAAAESRNMMFYAFAIADRSVPTSARQTQELIRQLTVAMESGKNVAIHCRQGLGRSPLIAIGALMLAGIDSKLAIHRVSAARGLPVPETKEQREWIEKALAEELLLARPK
jgi:protein-tyrosine phosphatase